MSRLVPQNRLTWGRLGQGIDVDVLGNQEMQRSRGRYQQKKIFNSPGGGAKYFRNVRSMDLERKSESGL